MTLIAYDIKCICTTAAILSKDRIGAKNSQPGAKLLKWEFELFLDTSYILLIPPL